MNIPAELTSRAQWVVWQYEYQGKRVDKETADRLRAEGKKPTKVPYSVKGHKASSTNPKHWATFQDALRAAPRFAGVGYVFAEDDPYVGVDLDDCIKGGALEPWAGEIIKTLPSYAEVSPSGTGVKIWVEGVIPEAVKTAQVEIYDRARYFTVTGKALPGAPLEIRGVNGALDKLYQRYAKKAAPSPVYTTSTLDDDYLRAWGERVIEAAVDKMSAALDGERHNVRLAMGRLLGGLIPHGLMTEDRAERILYETRPADANEKTEHKAIRDGIQYGKAQPLIPPPPPPQPVFLGKVACCPEHKRPLTRGKRRGWYCQERDDSSPSGWCPFWWEGKGYEPPQELVKEAPSAKLAGPRKPISAAELQRMEFTPLKWIVDSILPEGATLLAGKPKSKKSWLALAAAACVATGGKALGYYDTLPGTVLYLDLESNQRRMQGRLKAMLGATPWPEHFYIETAWERGEEGIHLLDLWMAAHPDTKLIVIDILQNFRPPRDPKGNPYDQDYEAVKMINEFAERHRIAVVIIHHTRKAKSDDVFDEISGTTGLSGGVASMWVLGRSPDNNGESILAIRGRDISDDDPMALQWEGYACQFKLVATGLEASSSSARRQILDVMELDQEYQLKEIAALISKPVNATSNTMRRLLDDNLVQRVGNGRYAKIPPKIAYKKPKSLNDFSTEAIEVGGKVVWRLWDDGANKILSEHATEAEAMAEAQKQV